MSKYEIDKELKAITNIKTPFFKWLFPFANFMMGLIFKCSSDNEVNVSHIKIKSSDNYDIPVNIIEPKGYENEILPILIFYHGGGFETV